MDVSAVRIVWYRACKDLSSSAGMHKLELSSSFYHLSIKGSYFTLTQEGISPWAEAQSVLRPSERDIGRCVSVKYDPLMDR